VLMNRTSLYLKLPEPMPSLLNNDECLIEIFFRMCLENRFNLVVDGI
jgi:hypothetical protein